MIEYFSLIICIILMVITHEFGHYIVIRLHKLKNVEIRPFRISYLYNTPKHIKIQIIIAGLVCGLLPISFFNFTFFWNSILIVGYSCVCTRDVIRLKELAKRFKWGLNNETERNKAK
jgi:hypothetical protein